MTTSAIEQYPTSPPIWLKVAATLGMVWYAFGLLQFWLGYSTNVDAAVASGAMTAAHGDALATTPALIWLAYAVASAAGLIGSALLFVSAHRARAMFAVSLVSAAVYYIWVYALSGTGADRPTQEVFIAITVITVTLGFALLSRRMT
ncbi:MAG: hypothetical protein V7661_16610 [Sulfitobacter sp.]